jgi:hypothetical protein
MCQKRHIAGVGLFTVALISISCLGQQVQEANRDPSPLYGTAPSQNAIPPIAPNAVKPALRVVAPKRESATNGPVLRSLFGQRADVGIFTVGNFNPASFVHLDDASHGGQQVVSSNKSSLGGGAEYRWRWGDRNAVGFLYVQNPSDGKLWVSSSASASGASTQSYIWPLMRWDFSILATQSFKVKNMAPFVCAGPGAVVTNGYGNSGWSAGFALVAGFGTDYRLGRRWSVREGVTFLNTRNGCYDDPTCHETWGVVEDLRVGAVYRWGGEKDGYAGR